MPGAEAAVETLAHLVHDGHGRYSEAHEETAATEDCADACQEHGCTPLAHHCTCCMATAALAPRASPSRPCSRARPTYAISSLTGRLNEILEITPEADPGTADLMTLRDLAEFEVNYRLLAVPGVAEVERLGGWA